MFRMLAALILTQQSLVRSVVAESAQQAGRRLRPQLIISNVVAGSAHHEGRRLRQSDGSKLLQTLHKDTRMPMHSHGFSRNFTPFSSPHRAKNHALTLPTEKVKNHSAITHSSKSHQTVGTFTHVAGNKSKSSLTQLSITFHDKQSRNSKHGSTEMKDIEVGPGSSDSDSDEDEAQAELDAQVSSLKRNVSRVDALIDENLHDQRRLESEILTLGDHEASAEEIKSSVEKVVNETSSPALGEMLGKMWSEMRMYAWPFYKETLEDGLDKLKDEEKQLQRRLAQAEDRLEMAEAKQRRNQAAEADTDEANERKVEKTPDEGSDDADEDDEQESTGQSKEVAWAEAMHQGMAPGPGPGPSPAEGPAPAPSPGLAASITYVPLFNSHTMPEVSPTVFCIICLTLQFFITYTSHAVVRAINQLSNQDFWKAQEVLEEACRTITYAPALSVLFLGTRMRAIMLSGGETEKYSLPPPWAQKAMYVCTLALPVQALSVLITASLETRTERKPKIGKTISQKFPTQEEPIDDDVDHDAIVRALPQKGKTLIDTLVTVVHFICIIALFCAAALVCTAALTMEGPEELWGTKDTHAAMLITNRNSQPPVSTAISCVLILVAAFFGVYFLHAVTAVYNHWLKETVSGMKLEWVLTRVQDSVNLAPMLSVLFIALRMRALQINPRTGSAQTWAMNCMVASTVFLLLKVFSMVVIPMCDVQSSKINGTGIGEVMFPYTKKYFEVSEAVVKHTCTCCIYGLALAIMAALFLLRSPDGPSMTPHVSPAMMCVTILCNLYFLAHISVYVAHTVTNIYPKMKMPHILMGVFDTGRKGVMYAPMLAILFLAARMRALQLTITVDGKVPPTAGPQIWAQEGMYLSTWAVFVQVLMAYLVAAILGAGNSVRTDMTVTQDLKNTRTGLCLIVAKYCCVVLMYIGACIVIVAIFKMTPETLPPYNEQSVLPVPAPPTVRPS